jgi:hypothetical protein
MQGGMMFSVGGVFSKSLDILFKNLAPILLLSLIMSLPIPIYSTLISPATSYSDFAVKIGILIAVSIVVGQCITAAIIFSVVQDLRGQRVSVGAALQRGIQLFLPVVGVAFLVGILTFVATLALVVPGFIVATILWVAIPVAVVERPGVTASLRRSAALTRGHRWGIFGLFLIMVVITGVSQWLLRKILAPGPYGGSAALYSLIEYARSAIVTAFQAVLIAVCYYYLRVEKEGVDIEKIAEAFD